MTKKRVLSKENTIHHFHHQDQGPTEEYDRAITLTGTTSTVVVSSNNPKETLVFLSNVAVALYKEIKELDKHVV